MPWTADDAAGHNQSANTPAKAHQWATVANKVLAESGDDGKAIRIANSAVDNHPSMSIKPKKAMGLRSIMTGRP